MNPQNTLPLIKLMEISNVRRKILQNLPSFHDISNLSQVCHQINSYILNEKITRNMIIYHDQQKVTPKLKQQFLGDPNMPNLEDLEFLIEPSFSRNIKNGRQFNGEVLSKQDTFKITIQNKIPNINDKEHDLIFMKIAKRFCLNCRVHKNTTTLLCPFFYTTNLDITLYTLSYMIHDNIKCIEIDKYILLPQYNKYKKLNRNIFGGFCKFNQLIINGRISRQDYDSILNDDRILKRVLKDLSERVNPILILKIFYPSHDIFLDFVNMIREITINLNIKLKVENRGLMFVAKKNVEKHPPIDGPQKYFLIKDYITILHGRIRHTKGFLLFMPAIKLFPKLEHLILLFDCFDFVKNLKKLTNTDINSLSIQMCNGIKSLTLFTGKPSDGKDDFNVDIFNENFKFLLSLMPSTIERINLLTLRPFTRSIGEVVDKFIPNLKTIVFSSALYDFTDCFVPFKNLEILICYGKPPTVIPRSVKLFAIIYDTISATKYKPFNDQKILNQLMERFSKCLKDNNGNFIFFNDITYWDNYKHIVMDNHFSII